MLGHRGNAVVVAEFLDRAGVANVVLDPVMKSTSGEADLLDAGGIKYICRGIMKRATVVTPNIAEAEILSGIAIKDYAAMEAAARKIVERGARAVVVKGGHMEKADRRALRRRGSAALRRRSRQNVKTRTARDARLPRPSPRNWPAAARCAKPCCWQKPT